MTEFNRNLEAASSEHPEKVGFDYAEVDKATANDMRNAADRVRGSMRDSVVTVGRELLAIKKRIKHGQFSAWVRLECAIALRTAERAIQAAELVEKNDKLSYLPADGLLALSSGPAKPVAEQIIKRIDAGEKPTAAEIKREISAVTKGENTQSRSKASLDGIQKAIKGLDDGQLQQFAAWFHEYRGPGREKVSVGPQEVSSDQPIVRLHLSAPAPAVSDQRNESSDGLICHSADGRCRYAGVPRRAIA
jgi:hypothetical protein